MAVRKNRKKRAKNGEGQTPAFLTTFNLIDPDELRAWDMARRLASPQGRRKRIIIGFLLALYDYERRTGIEINADVAIAMLFSRRGVETLPQQESSEIIIENATRVSAQEVAAAMMSGMNLDE